jgi:MFS family permease
MLICGQGLVGFGRAGVIVGNATLLAIICADKKMRTFYLGIITGAYAIMIKVSPLIAGGLLAIKVKEAWRGIFWIAVPLQGILILMVSAFPSLRRQAAHWRQLRELGPWRVLLHAASVVGLLLPLTGGQFSGTLDFTGSVLVVCYVLGPILFAAFLVADIRKPEETRMLPMAAIAANPRMILSLVVLTVAPALVTIAATFYSPPYFEIVRGLTPFKAALIPLPSILLGALTSVIVSKLYHRGPRWAQGIAIIASIMQIVGGGIFYAFPQDVNIYLIHMAYITAAIGTGMTFTMGMALVFEYVPDTRYGAAASLMNLASSLGAVLGTSIYGLILRWEIRKYIEQTIARALAAIPADITEDVKSAALREAVSAHQKLMEPSPEYRTVYHDSQRYACLYLYGSAGLCSLLAALVMGRHVMAKT